MSLTAPVKLSSELTALFGGLSFYETIGQYGIIEQMCIEREKIEMFIDDIKRLEDKHGIRIFPIVETFADGITPALPT